MYQLIAAVILLISLLQSAARADEPTAPSLALLAQELEPFIKKHYPQASFAFEENTIHFEFNTRKYLIHSTDMMGGWGDAVEEIGPQAPSRNPRLKLQGGVIGNISIRPGAYGGKASLPHVFHHHYFDRLGMAPYSKSLDCHLLVNLSYANDIPPDFEKQFRSILNHFDKYVHAKDSE